MHGHWVGCVCVGVGVSGGGGRIGLKFWIQLEMKWNNQTELELEITIYFLTNRDIYIKPVLGDPQSIHTKWVRNECFLSYVNYNQFAVWIPLKSFRDTRIVNVYSSTNFYEKHRLVQLLNATSYKSIKSIPQHGFLVLLPYKIINSNITMKKPLSQSLWW